MAGKEKNETNCSSCASPPGCGSGTVCRVESVLGIDERGQMVLPKDVREKAAIRTGDKLALISWEKEGKVCCLALMKVEDLSGMIGDILGPLVTGKGD
ncbi:MAG: AbrB/MazE/SpoVT family DNA-binding domain-containing protein [Methanoregulaceae archaeon]|nr:AbrB/MazE/SpoVT family DNA-binding domain-containing protein [Methanoregulaceae archaeon]